jgi:hypothetical protein
VALIGLVTWLAYSADNFYEEKSVSLVRSYDGQAAGIAQKIIGTGFTADGESTFRHMTSSPSW